MTLENALTLLQDVYECVTAEEKEKWDSFCEEIGEPDVIKTQGDVVYGFWKWNKGRILVLEKFVNAKQWRRFSDRVIPATWVEVIKEMVD